MIKTLLLSSLITLGGLMGAGSVEARPLPLPLSTQCTFNGVSEPCVTEWDTDGSIDVTYLRDGKRVHYGSNGMVRDGNRTYHAHRSYTPGRMVFVTQNGTTILPVR